MAGFGWPATGVKVAVQIYDLGIMICDFGKTDKQFAPTTLPEIFYFRGMTAEGIIHEMEQLPVKDRLRIIERTLKAIRIEKEKSLKQAVDSLYDDYKADKELSVFTQLGGESFYEAR